MMLRHRRAVLTGLAAIATGALALGPAQSQANYPNQTIRFIVGVGAGGATDTMARVVGERLSRSIGAPVVVENIAGGDGVIAAQTAARAAPDGYTVFIGSSTTHAQNQFFRKSIPYDPIKDFEPISRLGVIALLLGIDPRLPVHSVAELIENARANPGKLTFASGSGSTRLGGEMFKSLSGTDVLHVPYRTSAQALAGVIGGQIAMFFGDISQMAPQVKAGKVRGLAVSGAQRTPVFPELPTMEEAGLRGFQLVGFFAAFAPARTPAAIVTRLNREIGQVLGEKDTRDRLLGLGIEPAPTTPQQLTDFVVAEIRKSGDLARSAGIVPE
jgi:tripartite-type tricarboxylate transporter receptor subunit TctC